MNKYFLGWPIHLRAPYGDDSTHLTLKYIGDKIVSVPEIELLLEGHHRSLDLSKATWHGETFGPPSERVPVMVVSGLSRALSKTRSAVDGLAVDKYPLWRPHITMRQQDWNSITANNLALWWAVEATGPLTLFDRGKPVHRFFERDPVLWRSATESVPTV